MADMCSVGALSTWCHEQWETPYEYTQLKRASQWKNIFRLMEYQSSRKLQPNGTYKHERCFLVFDSGNFVQHCTKPASFVPRVFRRVREIAKCNYWIRHVCLSVCPSICPSTRMKQLGSHWTDFHEIWYLSIFRKSVEKIKVWLNRGQNNGVLYKKTNIHLWQYLAELSLE